MPISQISNLMSVAIGIICLFISIRAFFIYNLSRNDMLFILGFSMALIAAGTLFGSLGDAHLRGIKYTGEWARAFGACSGGLFIFLSALVTSRGQMQNLKRWQFAFAALFIVVALCTPLYPPITNPWVTFGLNMCRIVIYSCAFIRYAVLYTTKSTRFSFIMCAGFLVLVIGYCLNIPGTFQASLIFVSVIAAAIRIGAYITLLAAYSIG